MDQLKVGDVVHLNSENNPTMTVVEITGNEVECIYLHPVEKKLTRTGLMPKEAVTKVTKTNDYYR